MLVSWLKSTEYSSDGWTSRELAIEHPTWEDVERAIRRLEKFRFPWVELHLDARDLTPMRNCLTVMGGPDVFWLGCSTGSVEQLRLYDPRARPGEVAVWTSDQGFSDSAQHTTTDLALVLRVARHFAHHGSAAPDVTWERRQ